MADPAQIQYLLRLLDDETPVVRAKVLEKLRSFGPGLEHELLRQGLVLSGEQHRLLDELWRPLRNRELKANWLRCFELEDEEERIEAAFSVIADYQFGPHHPSRLGPALDALAEEFRSSGRAPNPLELSDFLFGEKGMRGADEDYYNPLNGNLVHVIESGRGIPISLVCLFILVGKRLGLRIHGCNVPNHFLARARVGSSELVFDCFSGGRQVPISELEAIGGVGRGIRDVLRTPASAFVIMGRVLRNLIGAYQRTGEPAHSEFMRQLLEATQRRQRDLAERAGG